MAFARCQLIVPPCYLWKLRFEQKLNAVSAPGPERVRQLSGFFSGLRESGVRLSIITKGNVGACRYLLEQEGLLQFFEQVFGMLGQFYGESDFDRANPEPSALEGSSDSELRDSKANLIRNLMSGESLAIDEACLVEDDPQEIASVQGICRSVFVAERRGMTEGEMEELRRLAGVKVPHQASETAAAKVRASKASVAKPQTAPPPPPPEGFSGICKAGGKSVPPKGPVPAAPPVGLTGVHKAGSKEPSAKVAAAPKSLAAGVQGESTQGRVKRIYFDFDQTISKIHVFKQLAGWEPGISSPHALSERGQIHRLKMLNTEQYTAGAPGASWTACALGGQGLAAKARSIEARFTVLVVDLLCVQKCCPVIKFQLKASPTP